jgi:release factor glutamine methyltransferase
VTALPAPSPTVGGLLHLATERLRASGSETARLDAEVLLAHVLHIDRTGVLAHPDGRVGDGQAASFEAAIARREAGEPVAYIRGIKEFHSLAFSVDGRALIPRPETELLVDLAVDITREVLSSAPLDAARPPFRIWDVGTGSGAIAISVTVALLRRGYAGTFRVLATDASAEALELALENAVGHGVADTVDFGRGDLLDVEPPGPASVDLIVANLPYIRSDLVPALPVAASFEPREALDGGPDGLAVIRRLMAALPGALGAEGAALLEIGANQGDAAGRAAAELLPGWSAAVLPDLAGSARVLRLDVPRDPA